MKTSLRTVVAGLWLMAGTAVPAVEVISALNVPNFHKVDDRFFRGAQPSDDGIRALAASGIRTIVDLRPDGENSHSTKHEAEVAAAAGMRYVNMPMKGMSGPSADTVRKVLDMLAAPNDGPVFLHCKRGADRTGTIAACYRIEHDHWNNQQALAEAKQLGMAWVEFGMKRFVQVFRPLTPALPVGIAPTPK